MKRLLEIASFVLLVFGAIFTSCSSNDVFDSTAEKLKKDADTGMAITGKIYTSGTSRASSSTVDSIMKNGFDIYAYEQKNATDTVEFFSSFHVESTDIGDDGSFKLFSGTKTINWPKDKNILFHAVYYPRIKNDKTGGFDNVSGFWFSGNAHLGIDRNAFDGTADVLVASSTGRYDSSTPNVIPTITFQFSHVTTQVAASVKAPDDTYAYVVERISIRTHVPDYQQDSSRKDGDSGYYSISEGAWIPVNNSASSYGWGISRYTLDLYDRGNDAKTAATTTATNIGTGLFLVPLSVANDTPVYVGTTNSGTIGTGDPLHTLIVSYSVYDKSDTSFAKPLLTTTTVTKDVTASIVKGNSIKFNITLPILPVVGGSVVSVTGWGSQGGVDVELQ